MHTTETLEIMSTEKVNAINNEYMQQKVVSRVSLRSVTSKASAQHRVSATACATDLVAGQSLRHGTIVTVTVNFHQLQFIYINKKVNAVSSVNSSLENGWSDLRMFFLMFVVKRLRKRKTPGKIEILEKHRKRFF